MSNYFNIFISLLFFLNIIEKIFTFDYSCGPKVDSLKVGDYVIVCIHIKDADQKLAMSVKVDEHSMIAFKHINEIYDSVKSKNGIEFVVQIGETVTTMPTVS